MAVMVTDIGFTLNTTERGSATGVRELEQTLVTTLTLIKKNIMTHLYQCGLNCRCEERVENYESVLLKFTTTGSVLARS